MFLRLRKAARKNGVQVLAVAPFATRGLTKMSGTLIRTAPGGEAAALDGTGHRRRRRPADQPGRDHPGRRAAGHSRPARFRRQARLADGHRRPAGLGAAPGRRPRRAGGRCAAEPAARRPPRRRRAGARADRARHGMSPTCPPPRAATPRASSPRPPTANWARCWSAASSSPTCPTPTRRWPRSTRRRSSSAWSCAHSAVTDLADVVFPVAPVVEKAGSFVNWEGRDPAVRAVAARTQCRPPDLRVLDTLADEIGIDLGLPTAAAAARGTGRAGQLGRQPRPSRAGRGAARRRRSPGQGEAVLTGWRMLLDSGRLQDGEPYLAGTARTPVARLSAATAAEIGAADGDSVTVSTGARRDHAAARDHRHARPGGVAAAELAGLGGAPNNWA